MSGTSRSDLTRLSAVDLVAGYRSGTLSPVAVHDAVRAQIEAHEPVINAFWRRDPHASRMAAQASERRWRSGAPLGPIDGVPVTLKENIARVGVPMISGCAAVSPVLPERDAPITSRTLESGGIIIGSTVMPDWGMLSSGVSSAHGITRSPWNPAWTTGGSSSGAGAAAAAGFGPLHVGSDIGGSLRLPATWLGLVSLKPSAGRIPLHAPYLGRCAGPLTRTVADAALFMSVLSRPDDRDWTSLPATSLDWDVSGAAASGVRGLRIGLQLDAGCGAPVEPPIAALVESVGAAFAAAGAVIEPLNPFMEQQLLDDLDLFWRVRSWRDFDALPAARRSLVLPYIAEWVAPGAAVSGARLMECYSHAMDIQQRTVAATLPFDVVLSPVAPVAAFPAEQPMPFPLSDSGMAHIGFTAPYNMSGQPAAAINCGFLPDGRPVGVQISGRRFDDVGVLRAAAWYEAHRPAAANPVWPM